MSPASRCGNRPEIVWSTTAAGTMSHTARGFASFSTRSTRESAPIAFSLTSSPTACGDRSNTTQLCPFLISRRTMLAPIRPSPTIASCIRSPFPKVSVNLLHYLGDRITQRFHRGSHSSPLAKDRCPGHQYVRSCDNYHRSSCFINSSVYSQLTVRLDLSDH